MKRTRQMRTQKRPEFRDTGDEEIFFTPPSEVVVRIVSLFHSWAPSSTESKQRLSQCLREEVAL